MLLYLLACPKPDVKDSPEDTGIIYKHSEIIPDSDSKAHSGDSAADDSDSPGHSGDSDEPPPPWTLLELYPSGITVGVGATWPMRLVGTRPDGAREVATGAVWISDDPTIAAVTDAGTVITARAGTTVLRAELEGLTAEATITVRDDGMMTVRVWGVESGAGREGFTIRLEDGTTAVTDARGEAEIPAPDAGPLTVTAWSDAWNSASLIGTISRSVVLPVYLYQDDRAEADLHGQVNFGGVEDAAWNEIVIGMAGASVQGELGSVVLDDLFADDRTISVIGFDVTAPSNLFVEGTAEDYYSASFDGPVAAWALTGPLLIADLPLGAGAGEALAVITSQLDRFSWGYNTGTGVENATAEIDIAPSAAFSDSVLLDLPPLPAGFNGTERYFLMAAEENPDNGWLFDGFGSGLAGDRAEVKRADPDELPVSVGSAVLVYNQVGGLGSGGPVCSAVAEVRDVLVSVPPLQDVAVIDAWDPDARTVQFTVDSRSGYVRLRLTDRNHRVHDIYTDGSWSGSVPVADPAFSWTRTDLELISLETSWTTFEDRAARGELEPRLLRASTMARTVMNN